LHACARRTLTCVLFSVDAHTDSLCLDTCVSCFSSASAASFSWALGSKLVPAVRRLMISSPHGPLQDLCAAHLQRHSLGLLLSACVACLMISSPHAPLQDLCVHRSATAGGNKARVCPLFSPFHLPSCLFCPGIVEATAASRRQRPHDAAVSCGARPPATTDVLNVADGSGNRRGASLAAGSRRGASPARTLDLVIDSSFV